MYYFKLLLHIHKHSHWLVQEASTPRYIFKMAEMITPKNRTNYGKRLAYQIPNPLNEIKDSVDFTKLRNSFKQCIRQKLVDSMIAFDI